MSEETIVQLSAPAFELMKQVDGICFTRSAYTQKSKHCYS